MTAATTRRGTILAAAGWLASCSSPSPALYTNRRYPRLLEG